MTVMFVGQNIRVSRDAELKDCSVRHKAQGDTAMRNKKKATPRQLNEFRKQDLDERPEYHDRENDLPQLGEAPSWQQRGPRHQQYNNASKNYQAKKSRGDNQ
jgi:hypothetical protein